MRSRLPRAAVALLLAATSAAVYSRAIGYGFVDFDDGHFVQDNPFVREGLTARSIRWAVTAHLTFDAWPYLDYWQPVTVLSRLLDVEMFGMDPRGHHATNILLHGLSTALLFLALDSMTRTAGGGFWRSAFAAALWGVHPLRVESVVWITERKDVLAGLFWMLTLLVYHRYVRRPGAGRMAAVAAVFALGLMAKPFLITLPFVLVLLDYWPLRRFAPGEGWRGAARLVREKIALFAMTVAATAIGIRSQMRIGYLSSLAQEPLPMRIAGALVDYVRYLTRLAWPYPMALPRPDSPDWPPAVILACALVVFLVTAVAWRLRGSRPYLIVGWLWFLGVLVPVIGFVQPGKIPLTDRYTYLSHIGLIVAVTWGTADVLAARFARGLAPAGAAVLVTCAMASILQARYWKDPLTLFGHAVAVTRDNFVAHYALGHALAAEGRMSEAAAQYEIGRAIRPAPAENTMGTMLAAEGHLDEAVAHFREAVKSDPRYADAHNNLGVVLLRQGKVAEARRAYETALRYRPRHAGALFNLARLAAAEGHADEALALLAGALAANPDLDGAYYSRANVLAAAGRFPEAEADYRRALRLRPANADAHNNLGRVLALQGRRAEAMTEYDAALALVPGHALAAANRAELTASPPTGGAVEAP